MATKYRKIACESLQKHLADPILKSKSESAKCETGFVVCVGNKFEEFKIFGSETERESTETLCKTFEKRLKKWNFQLKVSLLKFAGIGKLPSLTVCLSPEVDQDEPLKLSDIPLVTYKQGDLRQDLFYNFKSPLKDDVPQTPTLSSSEDITITVSTIPYIESTNGACQLSINLHEFDSFDYMYDHNTARGKPYYLLTSPDGYLVRIDVFYVNRNLYAKVSFMAGPNDEKLPYHFPHLFYAIVKHEHDEEKNVYAEPALKHIEKSCKENDWSYVYKYPIATYDEMAYKKVISFSKVLVKFCIVPLV